MARIAVTGHRGLPAATAELVDRELREMLAAQDDLTGLSCLADGADQMFARAVLDAGGRLEVIVPAEQYREGLPAEAHAAYDELFSKALRVHRLGFTESRSESHMQASRLMIDKADTLLAVWDGKAARGYGGTADIVAYARKVSTPVSIVWPPGASRD